MVKALDTHRAVNVAVPSADTIIEVDGDFITNIPDRSRLRRGQTPQAFDRQLISDAYDKALKDPNFRTTDDCGVVRTYLPEEPIFVVRGEESNMKLTYREDTYMMDKLFQLKSTEPNDVQIDAESFRGKVAVVFGGSYGIGKNIVEMLEQSGAHVHSFSRSATHTDVGDDNQVALALSAVEQKEGHIDYVINTAGVLNREPLASMEYDTILKAVQTNYMGTVNVALRARPYLQRTRGKLIFFTSSSYTRGRASIASTRRQRLPSSTSCRLWRRNGMPTASASTASTQSVRRHRCASRTSAWSPTRRCSCRSVWLRLRCAPCSPIARVR